MRRFHIFSDSEIGWYLFTDDTTADCRNCGHDIACVLNGVRNVFLDIFGPNAINEHPKLTVILAADNPTTFREQRLIFLSSSKTFHEWHMYEFSHELCHFMVPEKVCESYRWFEETLCQAMSWYVMWRIHADRAIKPIPAIASSQYDDMESYISKSRSKRYNLDGKRLSEYISENIAHLRNECYDRPMNTAIANEIFPLLQDYPELWKIVPYLDRLQDGMKLNHALYTLFSLAAIPPDTANLLTKILC